MSTLAPITALNVITDEDALSTVAGTYAAMADELARMVEARDIARYPIGRSVVGLLADLHVNLDELTEITPPPRYLLVRLANEVTALRELAEQVAHLDPVFSVLVDPLDELHGALVDQIALHHWIAA